ncbi:MAG: flagellar hook-associated protein FlgL [Steroidobacteraceae bacterium]
MRVATYQWQVQWLSDYLQGRNAVDKLQQQASSGRRLLEPADDPAAAARVAELTAAQGATTQYTENASVAQGRLENEESLLVRAGDLLQRVRELTVQAGTATTTTEAGRSIAAELRADLAALLDIANTKDARGEYVFAGTRSGAQPFVGSGGAVTYVGDALQRAIRVGVGQYVTDGDTGDRVFGDIPNGTGRFVARAATANVGTLVVGARSLSDPAAWDGGSYVLAFTSPGTWEVRDAANALVQSGTWTDGGTVTFRGVTLALAGAPATGDTVTVGPSSRQSVFATIDRLATALENGGDSAAARAAVANVSGDTLEDLDRALERLGEVRASVGARLQGAENAANVLGDASLSLTREISTLRDADMASTLSALSARLTGLDAAQQTFAKLQGLSLFNYLR